MAPLRVNMTQVKAERNCHDRPQGHDSRRARRGGNRQSTSGARSEPRHGLRLLLSGTFGRRDSPRRLFRPRPLLVVNTASLCGYTPQYAGLQQLWTEFRDRGLGMIGVPSNDFGGQEPGGADDIAETAQHQYAVTFPIAAKAVVVGPNAHPFYKWAAEARPKDVPRWNFHKYLIGRDGYIADVFASAVEPTDTRIKTAIGRALAAG